MSRNASSPGYVRLPSAPPQAGGAPNPLPLRGMHRHWATPDCPAPSPSAARNASSLGYVRRAMPNAPLTVFTTSWCGFCHRLKTVLKSDGISYDEVDIEQDPAAAEFVGSVNGGNRTVPTVKFADGSTLT